MADLTVIAANVRPLDGAITRRVVLAGAISLGDLYYISSYDNGRPIVTKADGDGSAAVAQARGILVSLGNGKSTGAANDVGVGVAFGPVAGFNSLTAGAKGYVSDTAGKIADAAGTNKRRVGYAESDTVFFFWPEIDSAACV